MKHTELNKGIGNQLGRWETILSKIKTRKPRTLFPINPEWAQLKTYRCPYCGNKLLYTRDRQRAYCKGKRHLDGERFYLPSLKVEEIRTKLQ